MLANHFLERLSHELGKDTEELSESAFRLLLDHDWPGNVRELENAIERAVVTGKGHVLTDDDFAFLRREAGVGPGWTAPDNLSLEEIEQRVIEATLLRTDGNVKEAATILGIDRSTLYDRIKKQSIPR